MKFKIFLLLTFFSLPLLAQNISIREEEAEIEFLFIDDDVDGRLSGFRFTGEIDSETIQNSTFSGSVEAKSIDTDNWLRDRFLRGGKYFDSKKYPLISFSSNSISGNAPEFRVAGTLTMKGIEREVVFNFKEIEGTFVGEAHINAAFWDINVHRDDARNMVSVRITLPYFNK